MNTYVTLFQATACNAFGNREEKCFVFRGVSFVLTLIANYIYNLPLTRRGINIIQSEYYWNEYIGYIIPGTSIIRLLRSRIITFSFAWRFVPIELNCELYIYSRFNTSGNKYYPIRLWLEWIHRVLYYWPQHIKRFETANNIVFFRMVIRS
jgi:hypothetical protein